MSASVPSLRLWILCSAVPTMPKDVGMPLLSCIKYKFIRCIFVLCQILIYSVFSLFCNSTLCIALKSYTNYLQNSLSRRRNFRNMIHNFCRDSVLPETFFPPIPAVHIAHESWVKNNTYRCQEWGTVSL